jgi:3-keto-5-aminohexanoate cleavage enzyme
MEKLIIEVRANEYEMRDRNPNIPWTAAEIAQTAAACRAAGAAIIHFHTRSDDGGPAFEAKAHLEAMAAVRAASDILIHATMGGPDRAATPEGRIAPVVALAEAGLKPDFLPLDMGSSNVDMFDAAAGSFRSEQAIYVNSTGTLRHFAETAKRYGIKPSLQIWNLPMLRWATSFADIGLLEGPLWLNLLLSEGGFLAAHPATIEGLKAFLPFLPANHRHQWIVTLGGADILRLAPEIIALGGHLCLGLGDYHHAERGAPTNAELVAELAHMAKAAGRAVASPAEVRAMLAMA